MAVNVLKIVWNRAQEMVSCDHPGNHIRKREVSHTRPYTMGSYKDMEAKFQSTTNCVN